MYYLQAEESFDSAHFLANYHGKCANIHGHRWKIVVKIKSENLLTDKQQCGMIVDFGDLKRDLRQITEYLDHCLIIEKDTLSNDLHESLVKANFRIVTFPFRPTAENIAKYVYDQLKAKYLLEMVDVYETPTNCASYHE